MIISRLGGKTDDLVHLEATRAVEQLSVVSPLRCTIVPRASGCFKGLSSSTTTMAEPVRRLLEVCKDTSSALGIPVVAPILTAVFSSMNKVLEEAKVGSPSQSTRQEADPAARIVAQRQG